MESEAGSLSAIRVAELRCGGEAGGLQQARVERALLPAAFDFSFDLDWTGVLIQAYMRTRANGSIPVDLT